MKKDRLLLILLLFYTLFTRIPYLLNGTIPFSFDHGRDSMAVIHMLKTGSLKFIGPWTSIPGLFFGPGWYYLLAPVYLISAGNPLAPVYLMLCLGLAQVWLAYKYLGKEEAVIMATAPVWIILSRSAANPFPITLITLLILIILKQVRETKTLSIKQVVGLGLLISLGFHFSSALSVFYVIIVPLVLLAKKTVLSLKKVLWGIGAFILPFIPQLLFEFKNNFIEVRALIKYLSQPDPQTFHFGKVKHVTRAMIHELKLAVLPEINILGNSTITWIGIGLLLTGLLYMGLKKKPLKFLFEAVVFLIIPLVGFYWLHFNIWYVYGLLPVAVILVGQVLRAAPGWIKFPYLALLCLTPLFILGRFYTTDKQLAEHGRGFLPIKLEVLDYIYQQAGDRPFASYHYLPEIYDYDWQYLYFWQAFRGRPLPVEFSYKPGETAYVTEKLELLSLFKPVNQKPEKVFLIINLPENKHHYPLNQWLEQIKINEVLNKIEIAPELEVWEARL